MTPPAAPAEVRRESAPITIEQLRAAVQGGASGVRDLIRGGADRAYERREQGHRIRDAITHLRAEALNAEERRVVITETRSILDELINAVENDKRGQIDTRLRALQDESRSLIVARADLLEMQRANAPAATRPIERARLETEEVWKQGLLGKAAVISGGVLLANGVLKVGGWIRNKLAGTPGKQGIVGRTWDGVMKWPKRVAAVVIAAFGATAFFRYIKGREYRQAREANEIITQVGVTPVNAVTPVIGTTDPGEAGRVDGGTAPGETDIVTPAPGAPPGTPPPRAEALPLTALDALRSENDLGRLVTGVRRTTGIASHRSRHPQGDTPPETSLARHIYRPDGRLRDPGERNDDTITIGTRTYTWARGLQILAEKDILEAVARADGTVASFRAVVTRAEGYNLSGRMRAFATYNESSALSDAEREELLQVTVESDRRVTLLRYEEALTADLLDTVQFMAGQRSRMEGYVASFREALERVPVHRHREEHYSTQCRQLELLENRVRLLAVNQERAREVLRNVGTLAHERTLIEQHRFTGDMLVEDEIATCLNALYGAADNPDRAKTIAQLMAEGGVERKALARIPESQRGQALSAFFTPQPRYRTLDQQTSATGVAINRVQLQQQHDRIQATIVLQAGVHVRWAEREQSEGRVIDERERAVVDAARELIEADEALRLSRGTAGEAEAERTFLEARDRYADEIAGKMRRQFAVGTSWRMPNGSEGPQQARVANNAYLEQLDIEKDAIFEQMFTSKNASNLVNLSTAYGVNVTEILAYHRQELLLAGNMTQLLVLRGHVGPGTRTGHSLSHLNPEQRRLYLERRFSGTGDVMHQVCEEWQRYGVGLLAYADCLDQVVRQHTSRANDLVQMLMRKFDRLIGHAGALKADMLSIAWFVPDHMAIGDWNVGTGVRWVAGRAGAEWANMDMEKVQEFLRGWQDNAVSCQALVREFDTNSGRLRGLIREDVGGLRALNAEIPPEELALAPGPPSNDLPDPMSEQQAKDVAAEYKAAKAAKQANPSPANENRFTRAQNRAMGAYLQIMKQLNDRENGHLAQIQLEVGKLVQKLTEKIREHAPNFHQAEALEDGYAWMLGVGAGTSIVAPIAAWMIGRRLAGAAVRRGGGSIARYLFRGGRAAGAAAGAGAEGVAAAANGLNVVRRANVLVRNALRGLDLVGRRAAIAAMQRTPGLLQFLNTLTNADEAVHACNILRSGPARAALAELNNVDDVARCMRGMMKMSELQLTNLTKTLGQTTGGRGAALLRATAGLGGRGYNAAAARVLLRGGAKLLAVLGPVVEGYFVYEAIVERSRLSDVRRELNRQVEDMFSARRGYARVGNTNRFRHTQTGFEVDAGPMLNMADAQLERATIEMWETGVMAAAGVAAGILILASNPVGWIILAGIGVYVIANLIWDPNLAHRRNKMIDFINSQDPKLFQFFSIQTITGKNTAEVNELIGPEAGAVERRMARGRLAVWTAMPEIISRCPVGLDQLTLPNGRTAVGVLSDPESPLLRRLKADILPASTGTLEEINGRVPRSSDDTMRLLILHAYIEWQKELCRLQGREYRLGGSIALPGGPVGTAEQIARAQERVDVLGRQYLGHGKLVSQYESRVQSGSVPDLRTLGVDPDRFVSYNEALRPTRFSTQIESVGRAHILDYRPPLEQVIHQGIDCYRLTLSPNHYCYYAFISGNWMWSASNLPAWTPVSAGRYGNPAAGSPCFHANVLAEQLTEVQWRVRVAPQESAVVAPTVQTKGVGVLRQYGYVAQPASPSGRVLYKKTGSFYTYYCVNGRWMFDLEDPEIPGLFSRGIPISSDQPIPNPRGDPDRALIDTLKLIERVPNVNGRRAPMIDRQGRALLTAIRDPDVRVTEGTHNGIACVVATAGGVNAYFACIGGVWMWAANASPSWDFVTDRARDYPANLVAANPGLGKLNNIALQLAGVDRLERGGDAILAAETALPLTRVAHQGVMAWRGDLGGGVFVYFGFVDGKWVWCEGSHGWDASGSRYIVPRRYRQVGGYSPHSEPRLEDMGPDTNHPKYKANAIMDRLQGLPPDNFVVDRHPRANSVEVVGVASLFSQTLIGPITERTEGGQKIYEASGTEGTSTYRVQFTLINGRWHWKSDTGASWSHVSTQRYPGGVPANPTTFRQKANWVAQMLTDTESGIERSEPLRNGERAENIGLSIILTQPPARALRRVDPPAGSPAVTRFEMAVSATGDTISFGFVNERWCYLTSNNQRWRCLCLADIRTAFPASPARDNAIEVMRRIASATEGARDIPPNQLDNPEVRNQLGVATLASRDCFGTATRRVERFGVRAIECTHEDGSILFFAHFGGRWHWASPEDPSWAGLDERPYGADPADPRRGQRLIDIMKNLDRGAALPPLANPNPARERGINLMNAQRGTKRFVATVPPPGSLRQPGYVYEIAPNHKVTVAFFAGRWQAHTDNPSWPQVRDWRHVSQITYPALGPGNAQAADYANVQRMLTALHQTERA
jgi:hypothetical protein